MPKFIIYLQFGGWEAMSLTPAAVPTWALFSANCSVKNKSFSKQHILYLKDHIHKLTKPKSSTQQLVMIWETSKRLLYEIPKRRVQLKVYLDLIFATVYEKRIEVCAFSWNFHLFLSFGSKHIAYTSPWSHCYALLSINIPNLTKMLSQDWNKLYMTTWLSIQGCENLS